MGAVLAQKLVSAGPPVPFAELGRPIASSTMEPIALRQGPTIYVKARPPYLRAITEIGALAPRGSSPAAMQKRDDWVTKGQRNLVLTP